LKNLIVCYDMCLNTFGDYVKKQRAISKHILILLLPPLTSIHLGGEDLLSDLPLYSDRQIQEF
jgi:hypothetical protein